MSLIILYFEESWKSEWRVPILCAKVSWSWMVGGLWCTVMWRPSEGVPHMWRFDLLVQ